MGRKKQLIVLPHLVDAGGDLTKPWFVEYSCRDPRTDKMKRQREYAGFAKLKTAEERYAYAEKRVKEIGDKLRSGWTPYAEKKVAYTDELAVQRYAERWGKERESVPTIRMYLSEFLQLKRETVIAHSYQTYRSKLRIFCEWAEHAGLDEIHVSCITQEHILDFMRYVVRENNVSRRTVKKYEQILHAFFEYLINRELITANPVRNIPHIGRVTDEAARPIPEKERRQLLAFMKRNDPQLWVVCQMEYYCAIRPNELRQLRIGDVDLKGGLIRVPSTISKNRKSELVNIPNQLARLLSDIDIKRYDCDDYLFSVNGQPGKTLLGKNNFRFRFDRIRNKLGLPAEYKLYSFKYTGASALVSAGIDTWELQRHMRHKSIETTEHYIRKNFAVKSDMLKNHFPDID